MHSSAGLAGQVVADVPRVKGPRAGGRLGSLTAVRGMFWVLLILLTLGVGAVATAGLWPLWEREPSLAAATTVLAAALFAIGFVLCAEPGQAGPGAAVMVSAAVLVISWANEWQVGPLPLLSRVFGNIWVIGVAWALYRYPDTSLSRAERRIFAGLLAWLIVTPWAEIVASRPEWHQFPAEAWWLPLHPDRGLYHLVSQTMAIGNITLLGLYVVLWVRKIVAVRPAVRRIKLPTAIAAVVAAGAGAAVPIGAASSVSNASMDVLFTLSALGILVVPAAFLTSVVRRMVERQGVADMLLRLRGRPTPDLVLASLREALHDPELQIAYWSELDHAYVANGAPVDEVWAGGDVIVADVPGSTGKPLARIRIDRASAWDSALVEATITASRLTLENAILLARVEHQLQQLRVRTLNQLIGTLEAKTSDPTTLDGLVGLREQLQFALRDLRDLALGLHPSRLRLGLHPALKELTAGYPFAVTLDLPEYDLPENVTLTAYYAISEALTNVSKHAGASSVRVRVREAAEIEIEIEDDGRGGAVPREGGGLSDLVDRVTAVGGRTQIHSPVGGGTRVRVWLPCH